MDLDRSVGSGDGRGNPDAEASTILSKQQLILAQLATIQSKTIDDKHTRGSKSHSVS